jgi:hypothetical protein
MIFTPGVESIELFYAQILAKGLPFANVLG